MESNEPIDFEARLASVRERIAAACSRSGRSADEVEIVAVTKTFGPEAVEMALDAGLRCIGESRVQETAWKAPRCAGHPEWHLIGHLQRNKARAALELYDVIHSLDSERLADHVGRLAEDIGARPRVLIEINTAGEASKSGVAPDAAPALLDRVMAWSSLSVAGLMTIPPFTPDAEKARPAFAALRALRDRLQDRFSIDLPVLSMGMSGDFDVAVEEGATWVRLGSVLLGPRRSWAEMRRAMGDDDSSGKGMD